MLSLRGQALALLSRREHSCQELRQKLMAHARKRIAAGLPLVDGPAGLPRPTGPDPVCDLPPTAIQAAIESVLAWLTEHSYLSDARFMESRVHSRASRQGTARIRQEMAHHGLKLDGDTLQQLRDTEFSRAFEVWQRRFTEPAASLQERAKQMRFLAARGFAADVVRRVVGGRDDDV